MRILLIAYEFPPSASPQSLRWTYLARELALLGNEVHVLTIDLGGSTPGLPELPPNVIIHRTHPGLFRGLVAWHRRRRQRQGRLKTEGQRTAPMPEGRVRASWKQSVSDLLQRTAEYIWFPDLRGEWLIPARRALRVLLSSLEPDVVVSSHEPATTLQLGLTARRAGFRWVADLGDPVLAPYTPLRWRRRARQLERDVCRHAHRILVTATSARELLRSRHGRSDGIEVITQGFPADGSAASRFEDAFENSRLELFYAGSFYSFRRPEELVQAVLDTPGIRLTIASINTPDIVKRASREHPSKVRLLGFIPHADSLQLQRDADVLISIANADARQVPGKFYEYLGAARPVLHLYNANPDDAASHLMHELGRGNVCKNERGAITSQLAALQLAKKAGKLEDMYNLELDRVQSYAWPMLAARLYEILAQVAAEPAADMRR